MSDDGSFASPFRGQTGEARRKAGTLGSCYSPTCLILRKGLPVGSPQALCFLLLPGDAGGDRKVRQTAIMAFSRGIRGPAASWQAA